MLTYDLIIAYATRTPGEDERVGDLKEKLWETGSKNSANFAIEYPTMCVPIMSSIRRL